MSQYKLDEDNLKLALKRRFLRGILFSKDNKQTPIELINKEAEIVIEGLLNDLSPLKEVKP